MTGVTKTYKAVPPVNALRECELRIDRGEYVAIMGPSGSGKSTLLNVLGLLDEPSTGEYRLDGQPTAGLSERDRSGLRAYLIGFVFQAFHLVGYRSRRRERRDRAALPEGASQGAPGAGHRRARTGRAGRPDVGHPQSDVRR